MAQVFARVTGTGSYLPSKRVSNHDMVELLARDGIETSNEWIVERTGIEARHFAADHEFSSDMAVHAARQALEAAGLNRSDVHVDFMIGSNQMDIDGIREDSSRVAIFRNGDWAI